MANLTEKMQRGQLFYTFLRVLLIQQEGEINLPQNVPPTHFDAICCSDFRYESNGIFVLGVGFFFFRQISTF